MRYIFLLFAALSTVLSAQQHDKKADLKSHTIKGQVLDEETKKPLASANVVLCEQKRGTSTDLSGYFTLEVPDNSEVCFTVSYMGYRSLSVTADAIRSGKYYSADRSMLQIKLQPVAIPAQSVLVSATIGQEGATPVSFSKIREAQIEEKYTWQDVPELLSSLPSTTFYSESGNGIGYNYISIRGFDQRRISVAINGIPQNDPEDHNVYWLDFPDLLSSTELIQVQRGAGSGVIGYPSIGGSINIITSVFKDKPDLRFSALSGSYNTRKYSAELSSGLIDNRYSIYAKFSKTLSSGYRNSSWADFNAYHISAVRYDDKLTTQFNFYGGPISDGLAYNGLAKFAIKDRKLRRQNLSYFEADANSYSYAQERRSEETEKFSQPHYELLNEYKISDKVTLNSGLFYVLGEGYYDYDGSWISDQAKYFRLLPQYGFPDGANPGNTLIRAQVDNTQYGWIPRVSVKHENGEFIAGAELRIHRSLHWGSIIYADNLPAGVTRGYRYYEYKGGKDILNLFVHENYKLNDRLSVLLELQGAMHRYRIYEEKFLDNEFTYGNIFLNPRLAFNYKLSEAQNIYLSYANVSREPRLKNYYDAAEASGGAVPMFEVKQDGKYDFNKPLVKPENMNDFEAGTVYSVDFLTLSLNGFYMLFNNEIVKNGKLDRFGQPMTGNVDKTVHYGLEMTANLKPAGWLEVVLNGTLSKNYIRRGLTYLSAQVDSEEVYAARSLDGNRIAGFPSLLLNGAVNFRYHGLLASLSGRYSGSYFSDNYDTRIKDYLGSSAYDNKVDAYFSADFFVSYQVENIASVNSLRIFAQVNNLFDRLYAAYAIGNEFYPAAERNFAAGIELGL